VTYTRLQKKRGGGRSLTEVGADGCPFAGMVTGFCKASEEGEGTRPAFVKGPFGGGPSMI